MLNKRNIKLGIAPIAWTNDDLPELGGHITFEQCIDEMQIAGYQGCEVGNKYPRDPHILQPALDKRNLSIASAWFSSFFTEGRDTETINAFKKHRDFLKAMGAKVIVVCECGYCIQGLPKPVFEEKPVFNDQQWEKLVKGLHQLGELAKKKEMSIVYHHHMGTGIQTLVEIARLMAATDPNLVSLLADTGHATYSGDDPLDLFNSFGTRIEHIHLKDIRREILEKVKVEKLSFLESVKEGIFTVPGDGMIEFPPIFQAVKTMDYKGWLVVEAEQDPEKANPLDYAKVARKYIAEKTGL